ncbi:MAG: glycerol-3-phosphate 1-O-acyltransferase PlsY [Gemmatimonadota bacterium]
MKIGLLAALAYLLGSIPTSYLMGRLRGMDLREHGSGNLGGTNAYRVLGAAAGLVVVLVDIGKGLFPALAFPLWDGAAIPSLAILYGVMAITGHVWSVFVSFSGGKGVATAAGVMIALAPLTMLVALLVWLGMLLTTGIVSAASITAATVVPFVAFFTDAGAPTVGFCVALALFVWWTHRENMLRLSRGEEKRILGRRRSKANPGQEDGSA